MAAWNGRLDFIMIKASEGPIPDFPNGYHDTQFDNNWLKAERIDVYRFAYHFARPDKHPVAQADFFGDIVIEQGLGVSDNLVLDLEVTGGLTPVEVSFWAWTFMHRLSERFPRHKRLVYTFPAFADAGNCAKLGAWPLWIANYDVPEPDVHVGPWTSAKFWQYASSKTLDYDYFIGGDRKGLEDFCVHEA